MISPKVLSIAGFDPSAGAGILSDIKTFQNFRVYGFGVITAITIQNEKEIKEVKWLEKKDIKNQIDIIFKSHSIFCVKIGIIENPRVLAEIIHHILNLKPEAIITWDPVLKSSSGFTFWQEFKRDDILKAIDGIYLITPNNEEFENLVKCVPFKEIVHNVNILQKSSEVSEEEIVDYLWDDQNFYRLAAKKIIGHEKHGSGCILSSGITACLSLGFDLKTAIYKSRENLNNYRIRSNSLLSN
ncbi:hydroxymethylpyrimidine/phosphomethylpyrimidine kinase [Gramella sp. AN32]|uniref:hydroxymethylpyrimidine kinase n=1 Tax=Christiangramia antarctica TaxID=2058158 RepID=A0ABW5X5W1_9FLAO|nr:hydroxymethylpyrimidine/phosphomethylpyrimidine kinase [Gramella sp. AN32]MCM4157814.1 hydroxymethylpyrimidine/phosphomethylpyrimidine kinase [Gramella sp. AN32]